MKADLVVTDPPYNVAYGTKNPKEAKALHRSAKHKLIENDDMGNDEFRQFLTDVFVSAKTAMKPGAAIYVFHADNEGYNFRGAMIDAGFTLRQTLIWEKDTITLGRQDYQSIHEPILYAWNDGGSHAWYNDRKQSTILKFDRPKKSELHPTMKPIPLYDYMIKNSSKAGDAVLDLFGGSGTLAMACEQNGRSAYMCELDPHYVNVILDRYINLVGSDKDVFLINEDGSETPYSEL